MFRSKVGLFALFLSVACATSDDTSPMEMDHGEGGAHQGGGHGHIQVPRRSFPDGAGAPLFHDLGNFEREISSGSELAQKYFNQGLILAYGFNHAEALRSFREAAYQDPECAMCVWGEALVVGPNINKPMDDADVPEAWQTSRRALALAAEDASPVERALIEALAQRYAAKPVPDRSALDRAYANAMRQVAQQFPEDPDVLALFAEALMDTMPWDYYQDPDTPRPAAQEALAALESAMALDPKHPGALHFYIHAVEPSSSPERAELAADTLGPLSPGAGHLVHMPSHIYLRVGRYHDASRVNELAAEADESYISQCRVQGFYPAAYYPHNVHFLYASAAFEGRSALSIEAARKLSGNMTPSIIKAVPITEEFAPMELFALVRFGRWEDVMVESRPPAEWRYVTGVWHFARGMAAAALHHRQSAGIQLAALLEIAAEPELSELVFASGATPAQLLSIGAKVLSARMAGERKNWDLAIRELHEAVALQDALPYTEPPPWYFPVREALGHALLQAGRPVAAEAEFRRQLVETPRNGWSLHGLVRSVEAQGRDASAERRELAEVWQHADFELSSSVL